MFKPYIKHYGVKGMKWGVRRYQNYDGTLTALGKERNKTWSEKDPDAINEIYRTMSERDKRFVSGRVSDIDEKYGKFDPDKVVDKENYSHKGTNAFSYVLRKNGTPVAWAEGYQNKAGRIDFDVGVRGGDKYRRKGYATKAIKKGMEWVAQHPEIKTLRWDPHADNTASIALAEKFGFIHVDSDIFGDGSNWESYEKQVNRKRGV